MCKKYYIDTLVKEFGIKNVNINNPTYIPIDDSFETIMKSHNQFITSVGLEISEEDQNLPYLYWTPKLHKSPYKHWFIAGSSNCTTKDLSCLLKVLSTIKDGLVRYCNTKTSRNGANNMWILKNSTSLLSSLDQFDVRTATSVQTFDFSTLYTSIPHIYRYIDDLIDFNNKKFLDYLKEIYPSQLTVEKANKSDHLADYLDLTFIIDSGGKLSTRLYDKRDDFDFHTVNFPYLSSNIPSGPSYGVYISQLIRYARCCSHYDDFRYCLVDRLLSQGYIALRLEKSFKKFYGRYQDLIEKYQRSVNVMVNDSFPG